MQEFAGNRCVRGLNGAAGQWGALLAGVVDGSATAVALARVGSTRWCSAHPPSTRPALPHRRFTGNPVTSQPDVTELALHEGDEFLVVASDGLWDVLDSPEVVKLARRDLQRGASPQVGG